MSKITFEIRFCKKIIMDWQIIRGVAYFYKELFRCLYFTYIFQISLLIYFSDYYKYGFEYYIRYDQWTRPSKKFYTVVILVVLLF